MSHLGSVLENRPIDIDGDCIGVYEGGILSEFAVKSEQNFTSIFFVHGSTLKMYKGHFDQGSIVNCHLVTSMGSEMIKDLSFSRSGSGDQVFWINTTDHSVWSIGQNQFKPVQTSSSQIKPVQTSSNQFKPFQTSSNQFKQVQTSSSQIKPVRNQFLSRNSQMIRSLVPMCPGVNVI